MPPRIFGTIIISQVLNACEVWGVRVGFQVFKREFHTHIHLN